MTEKYAQSLEAGSVPIVIGPPNIADYEPAPGSVLAIDSMEDVPVVATRVQHLLQNRCVPEVLTPKCENTWVCHQFCVPTSMRMPHPGLHTRRCWRGSGRAPRTASWPWWT